MNTACINTVGFFYQDRYKMMQFKCIHEAMKPTCRIWKKQQLKSVGFPIKFVLTHNVSHLLLSIDKVIARNCIYNVIVDKYIP